MVAIIDVYSRFVVGWELTNSLEVEGGLRVFGQAVARFGSKEIINSDQGSLLTSEKWLAAIRAMAVRLSMNWKWRALDNTYI